MLHCRATLCLTVTGDPSSLASPHLLTLLEAAFSQCLALHLGFSKASISWRYLLGRHCPEGSFPTRAVLPGGTERFSWTSAGGYPVHIWNSGAHVPERELTTALLTNVSSLTTDYVLWFEAGCQLEAGWWEALLPLLEQGTDYLGGTAWVDYAPKDLERLQSRPWYRGVPLERRDGRPGVSFMNPFWGVRTACLQEIENSGERNWRRWSAEQTGGWPVLLGEIARQLSWSRAAYDPTLGAAPDSPRKPAPLPNNSRPAIPNPESRVQR